MWGKDKDGNRVDPTTCIIYNYKRQSYFIIDDIRYIQYEFEVMDVQVVNQAIIIELSIRYQKWEIGMGGYHCTFSTRIYRGYITTQCIGVGNKRSRLSDNCQVPDLS